MKQVSFRNDVLPLKNIIYRLALRITLNKEEAEDIVQDTLIKVWNKREQWDQIESIEAYSLTIARNISLDRVRRKAHQPELLDESETSAHASQTSNPYESIYRQNQMRIVEQLMETLPEKQRLCFQLRDFEGKSYKEIAQVMDISEDQVKVNIFRARQAVKTKYEQIDQYGL